MRIAFSALSGIGYGGLTYFKNILPALAKVDPLNEYVIFMREQSINDFQIKQRNFRFIKCSAAMKYPAFRFFWEQFILPLKLKKMNVDVLFTAKNLNVFLTSIKTVIAIRNMEPLCYRQYKNYWKLNIVSFMRKLSTIISMNKADGIIAVSEFTRKYLAEHYPHITYKLYVVYNGNPVSDKKETEVATYGSSQKYILTSSKYVAYANQLNLVKGYAMLKEEIEYLPPLWMVGGIQDKKYFGKVKKFIAEKDLTDKIRILGLLPHEELMKLYLRAFAFVFPSTLEACPQTLIEAMACGVPIATSNVGPMPEICRDAAIYFDPFDKKDIAEKIRMLLVNRSLRNRLRKASLERCHFFNWEKTATETLKVMEKANMGTSTE